MKTILIFKTPAGTGKTLLCDTIRNIAKENTIASLNDMTLELIVARAKLLSEAELLYITHDESFIRHRKKDYKELLEELFPDFCIFEINEMIF